jgi:3-hydroxybutyryl-CoA dehydrogenase
MKTPPSVAVIGAGTMGHALALVHALGGCRVRLQDVDAAALERAPALIDAALATLVEAGLVEAAQTAAVRDRIETVAELAAAVGEAELVVEAVIEDVEVKRRVFAALDEATPATAIIASNTSHLDVFPLLPEARQARSLIAHWYTPPYVIDLVDLAPGPATTPDVMETMRALYEGFGKAPIVFDSLVPSYVANRLQSAMNLEIFRLLDEGRATARDIDDSIRHGLALRLATLGHLKKTDYTGLEMAQRALANRTYTPPTPTGHSRTLDDLVAAGRTGVMAGAGFYDYGEAAPAELFRRRDLKLLRLKKALQEIERELDS